MILIISEELDSSTNKVLDWTLDVSEVIRVNKYDLKIISIDYQEEEILFQFKKNNIISSKNISSFWYRRGYISNEYYTYENDIPSELRNHIFYHLDSEWRETIRFVTEFYSSNSIKSLGNYQIKDKKLTQLHIAKKVGLKTPRTLITSNKKELLSFKKECNHIITKGIGSSPSFTFDNSSLEGYTEIITDDFISSIPSTFFPSLFQENIEKQYELRIFYLKGKFYSMAIFSQKSEETKIDVRKYDNANPNRVVPYKIPEEIEQKLHQFMLKMDLDTGSIDLVVDHEDKFYFLEVNPNGQFGMVSTPCNYYIEREIVKELV